MTKPCRTVMLADAGEKSRARTERQLMSYLAERVNAPISTRELERRWAAIRTAMAQYKIDVLLMQNNNDCMGGYVKYFTDIPAVAGCPVTVVFPRDDLMTVIIPGHFGFEPLLSPDGECIYRGVKKLVGAPAFASANYSWAYDAELAEKALADYMAATIGIVGLATMPVSMLDRLRRGRLANAAFVDASELVDCIKCIKSEEEIGFIRRTAALQDRAMATALRTLRPGKREFEIAAAAEYAILEGGGEQAAVRTCSQKPGEPCSWNHRHTQSRMLREGDLFSILIESNGPGGFYAAIGRSAVLGQASAAMKDEFALLLEARKLTLDRLRRGASCKEIWQAYNGFLRRHGRPEERRLYCHGQGYDVIERPLMRQDEPMLLQNNMTLSCHPTWIGKGLFASISDNYLLEEQGTIARLHQSPEILCELG
jgi:Xaa-Pro aminopeptidase